MAAVLPILRVLSFVPIVLGARVRREERRLIQWFRARGALDVARATTVRVDGPIGTWVYDRLVRHGVIKADGERVYLEEAGYTAFRRRRQYRAVVALALLLVGLAIAFVSGDGSL